MSITVNERRIKRDKIFGWQKLIVIILILFVGALMGYTAIKPSLIRVLLFGALLVFLVALNIKYPRVTMLLMLGYLPVMGFVRRLIIPVAGWSSFDPLVILVPGMTLFLGVSIAYKRFVLKQKIEETSPIRRLVGWMLIIHLFQVLNPLQGGFLAGLGGIMFYVVPLVWMILSRIYFNEAIAERLAVVVLIFGTLSAAYGLRQTYVGFLPFEQQWINLSGYAALIVGDSSRAFSTFTSAAEYAQFLGMSIIIGWGYMLKGSPIQRIAVLPALILMGYALFMESSRGIVVTVCLGIAIMSIVAVQTRKQKLVVTVMAILLLIAVQNGIAHIKPNNNALVTHQVQGLSDPFNAKQSTLGIHTAMMLNGFLEGLKMPIGHGLGSTTLAADKFGSSEGNAEVDLSNMFISDGLVGGTIYLVLVINVLKEAFKSATNGKIMPSIILGILITGLGQWSNAGNYSTVSLIWVFIGVLDRMNISHPDKQLRMEDFNQ